MIFFKITDWGWSHLGDVDLRCWHVDTVLSVWLGWTGCCSVCVSRISCLRGVIDSWLCGTCATEHMCCNSAVLLHAQTHNVVGGCRQWLVAVKCCQMKKIINYQPFLPGCICQETFTGTRCSTGFRKENTSEAENLCQCKVWENVL